MAKYTINHICGHQSVADICGPESGRAGQRDRMETRMCSDCYHKQQAQAVAAASTELPTLIGSDKQVQWALTIRLKMLADAQRYADQKIAESGNAEKVKTLLTAAIEWLKAQTDARYWIDNRQRAGEALMMDRAKIIMQQAA